MANKRDNKKNLKKVFAYIKRYAIWIGFSMVLAVMTVLFTLYVPILIGRAIDGIVYGQVKFDWIGQQLLAVVVLVALTALTQWVMSWINNKVTYHVVRDIRDEAFRKIEVLPLKYLDTHPQGEIISRVITDVDQFADGLLMGFTQFFTGIVTILGTLYFMLTTHVGITLVVILITPLSLVVASKIAKKSYAHFKFQSETRAEQTAFIDEMIEHIKVVKAYNHEEEALEAFDTINNKLQNYSLSATFISSIAFPSTRFVNGIVYAGVALTGALTVLTGRITVGALSCFLSYANQYTKPFNEISGVVTELQNAMACAARIFELIEEEAQVPDGEGAKELNQVEGEVVCEKVNFSYGPNQKLIEDFNIHIKPGQKVAIVGPTGCGKTTLINLLMRFYDVKDGSIYVDGNDIKQVTRNSLRLSYGMVLQDTWLKKGTIKDNIKMGKGEATDEEVIEAAKLSHAHSFIKRLPQGYDTIIGEEGGLLSQGQKQLLCITRIMLMQPPMLILDEATSSIDTRTEMKIQRAFNRLMEGRTSFIVAHRLSTIEQADVILVMKEGKIVEQGNHEALLLQKGFYAELYKSQFAI